MVSVHFAGFTLYEIFAYFFIYAFFGWIAEVGFHAVTRGEFVADSLTDPFVQYTARALPRYC